MQLHCEAQPRIRQGNRSFRSDTMNAGMTAFRRIQVAFAYYSTDSLRGSPRCQNSAPSPSIHLRARAAQRRAQGREIKYH